MASNYSVYYIQAFDFSVNFTLSLIKSSDSTISISQAYYVGFMSLRGSLLQLLADGRFYSGAWLGRTLGVSRNTIWKHIHFLQRHQVDIHAVRGRGYRLAKPVELLSSHAIRQYMDSATRSKLGQLDILMEIDSTNRYLMARAAQGAEVGDACLAEYQSEGRGRLGREWISPFAANIYLSLLWRFPGGAEGIAGLGLAIGVTILRSVQAMGADNVYVKWPNDLVCKEHKLSGILLELRTDRLGACHVVIGIGLNIRMPYHDSLTIDQPWIDLEQVLSRPVSRNQVAAILLQQLLKDLEEFQSSGLASFIDEWRQNDVLNGRSVTVTTADRTIIGIARGIDDYGALRLEYDGKISRFLTGDVSVRATL